RGRFNPYAIILTQDCDLEQDFHARKTDTKPANRLPSILFCEVATAEELSRPSEGTTEGMNSRVWNLVRRNRHERYYFLQKVDPAEDAVKVGLPELGVDFKRYFTIPADEVYSQFLRDARRRCNLCPLYLEHFSTRFAQYLSRIALPGPHVSEP